MCLGIGLFLRPVDLEGLLGWARVSYVVLVLGYWTPTYYTVFLRHEEGEVAKLAVGDRCSYLIAHHVYVKLTTRRRATERGLCYAGQLIC